MSPGCGTVDLLPRAEEFDLASLPTSMNHKTHSHPLIGLLVVMAGVSGSQRPPLLQRVVPWIVREGGDVATSRAWIVAVLMSLFAMHGVSLMTPNESRQMGHGAAWSTAGQYATAHSPAPLPDVSSAGQLPTGGGTLLASEDPMRDAEPGHGAGAHISSLCLAVLAGLLLLGSLLLRRQIVVAVSDVAVHRLRWMRRWPGLPRPPELSALCLLRI